MGATNFIESIDATSARDGYEALCRQAEFECGHDPYNGTISTCGFYGVAHTTGERHTKTSEKKAMAIIEREDYGRKREARAIDCGVVGYRIDKMVKVPHTKADAIFQTVFTVRVTRYDGSTVDEGDYKTQAEANARLSAILPRYVKADAVEVVKRSKKVKGKSTVATRYERQSRIAKTKPKTTPKGTVVTPIHHYIYYGWAAC